MKRMIIQSLYIACLFALFIYSGCTDSKDNVLFFSFPFITNHLPKVNSTDQLHALTVADPEQDAGNAYKSGDLRFIGDRLPLAIIPGVPADSIVESSIHHNEFKIVAFNYELSTNADFIKRKDIYEDAYNRTLYSLMKTNSIGAPSQ